MGYGKTPFELESVIQVVTALNPFIMAFTYLCIILHSCNSFMVGFIYYTHAKWYKSQQWTQKALLSCRGTLAKPLTHQLVSR